MIVESKDLPQRIREKLARTYHWRMLLEYMQNEGLTHAEIMEVHDAIRRGIDERAGRGMRPTAEQIERRISEFPKPCV